MNLLELIHGKYKVISVVGMSKNSGKTVTLNQLIDECMEKRVRVGITSTGRDGEREDLVTSTEKPMIYVDTDTILATSEATLKLCEAKLEILEVTNINTSMGKIVMVKTKSPGYVQVAGPSTNFHIKEVCNKLLANGAELVIVDGAIDRKSSASPSITEATILATGAVLSRDMNKVIEKTMHQVQLFSLEKVQDNIIYDIAKNAIDEKKYIIIDENYDEYILDIKTALNSGNVIGDHLDDRSRYVIMAGSLVTNTLKQIMRTSTNYKNVTFVVSDPTKIFIDSKDYMYFKKMGIEIKTLDSIVPLAVTINPYAPQGYYFDPKDFLENMKRFLNPVPVVDVVLGGE
ncbi:MAG: hypothetical protein N4A57_05630 [Anaeromicrobium sp.]|jgi:hypothetical protein|uniref:lysine 5,6-aminomutase reactivase subunit KamB n=1 Tax=Anaeromicrobium sp. TaxID=1929132 RepID=UPI0025D9B1C4|nr:hypothetical protein [Anaeromicrobium sp.]MCT4593734.1 hypothetical protein [Anaeromicrobium sp.]